jgi:hypothetical protein
MASSKAIFFLLLASSLLFGENTLSDNFFGYRKIVVQEDNKQQEDDKFDKYNIVVTEESLEKLTPDEYKKLLEEIKAVAVKRQADQDIKNLLIMQSYQQKKADSFTQKATMITLENQNLDQSIGISKSKFAKNVEKQAKKRTIQEFDKMIKDNAILVVFYDEEQETENRAFEMVLNFVYAEKGIEVQFINKKDGFGKKFSLEQNISFTPDLWILYKGKNPIWHRLASGIITKNRVYEQIDFVYYNFIQKEIGK